MHLKLDSAKPLKREAMIWYTLHPLNEKGELCRTTREQRAELQVLLPRIEAQARRVLGEWFRQIEYNPHSKTLDLCFTTGVSSDPDSRHRFTEFKGWLAIFSEESVIHTNETADRISHIVTHSK